MAKIIFFQAHPDDLEGFCAYLLHYLATQSPKQHEIRICSTTKGDFRPPGGKWDRFKGDVLGAVRKRELENAVAIHSIHPDHVNWLGYIDGFVKFDRSFIDRIATYIQEQRPDIIFAPEALFTWYYHRDHTYTGSAVFYAIYHHLVDFTPNLYFYTSINSNFYFPVSDNTMQLSKQLIACHRTQFWFFNAFLLFFSKILLRIYGFKNKRFRWTFKYAESYRRVYLGPDGKDRK